MKYKTSDIITKALQIADLTNSDFISWYEKVSMINDAYTMLYQKLIDIGDGSFVKDFVATYGENVLPPDFWQIKCINMVNNKTVTPVKRRADSEGYNTLSYEVRFDKLYINGTPCNSGDIVVSYWAKPKTLTFKPEPAVLNPLINDGATVLAVHDQSFFSYKNKVIYKYDCKTDTETHTASLSANPTLIIPADEQAYVLAGSTEYILTYDGMTTQTITGTPFITEGGAIGVVDSNNKGMLNGHYVFDWEYGTGISHIVCDDDYSDFWYRKDGFIYHNGEKVLVNDEGVSATVLFYYNGDCWYYKSNEVGYVDADENLHIVSMKNGVKGINKIDGNTGYGYTVGTTVYPWVEDTVLDFPNSMYFQIMSYMLGVQFKIKQGADASGIQSVLSSMEQTFYDTLSQDANQPIRIKNVY